MPGKKNTSQIAIIREFFLANPNRDISHPEVVDWAIREFADRTGKIFRDPDRGIRKLYQEGFLQKAKKGVYRYDPNAVNMRKLQDFTPQQKEAIMKRDGYKCVIGGESRAEGFELQVDHIKPQERRGEATIENGQTLCAMHNFRKKTYSQTESGKKMFIRLLELAKVKGDDETVAFCEDILKTFESHDVNGHIEWHSD